MADHRVVLVTGAAQGIGRAVAERFGAAGDVVMLLDVEAERLQATGAELAAAGIRCETAVADIRDRAQIRAAIHVCRERYGRLDVLASSAAVTDVKRIMEIADSEWQTIIDVNLTGTFRCIQEAARAMIETGGGAIVITTSTNSFWVETGTAAYSASKGGLLALIKTAALDLAPHHIRVNAVAPGMVRTRLTTFLTDDPVEGPEYLKHVPLGRFAEPADIAETVYFLASDAARYITGEQLVVDGGVSVGVMIPEMPR